MTNALAKHRFPPSVENEPRADDRNSKTAGIRNRRLCLRPHSVPSAVGIGWLSNEGSITGGQSRDRRPSRREKRSAWRAASALEVHKLSTRNQARPAIKGARFWRSAHIRVRY
jgi:hypothetical protein